MFSHLFAGISAHAQWLCYLSLSMCFSASSFAAPPALQLGDDGHYELAAHTQALADPSQQLSLQQAIAALRLAPASAAASRGAINYGYTDAAWWFRVDMQRPANSTARWLLEIGFPTLDHIDIFAPDQQGQYQRISTGNARPFAERPYAHRNFIVPLELGAGATAIYLRVRTEGALTLPLSVWESAAFHQHEQRTYTMLALYFGMLLTLMLYNLLLYLSVREPIYLLFVAFVGSAAIAQAASTGIGSQYLWPSYPLLGRLMLPIGMAAAGFFGALFAREFLCTSRMCFIDRVMKLCAATFVCAGLSTIVLGYRAGLLINTIVVPATCGAMIFAGVWFASRRQPGARWFALSWVFFAVGVLCLALQNAGWLPTDALSIYAMQIGSAFEILCLAFALADRINTMREDKEQAQKQALLANDTMLYALRQSEIELEVRVGERTRELASANARLLENTQYLRKMVHHDALTGLANRVLLYDRLNHAIAQRRRDGGTLAVMLLDLDDFKPVNDQHGHAVGDCLLMALAHRLSALVREGDTVARIGGDEFVIVLEDVASAQAIDAVMQKLVAEAARPFEIGARMVRVTASVGVALFPKHADDVDMLLVRADEAMYRAKNEGRNGYRQAVGQN